jgi:hypothetical protein
VSVAQLAEFFINDHAKPKRKARTAADYAAVLNNYLVPELGKKAANRITAADVSKLHLSLQDRP